MNRDYRLLALKRINDGIKAAKPLKEAAYRQRKHELCAEYKSMGIRLGILKTLTVLEMEAEGTIAKGNTSIQYNPHGDTLLAEYYAGGYSYHLISASEPDADTIYPEYVATDHTDYTMSPCIVAYQNYLYSRLSARHKQIADLFLAGYIDLGERTLDTLRSLGIKAAKIQPRNDYGKFDMYNIVFTLDDTVLCRIAAYLSNYYDVLSIDDDSYLELLDCWDITA